MALNACASFLEGLTWKKLYNPTANSTTYAHLFQGPSNGVCVVWNTAAGMSLTLPIAASKLQAFDTMGNPVSVAGTTTATVQIPAERPTYLRCAAADYTLLDTALGTMQVTSLSPVAILATAVVGGVQVTLTGQTSTPVDGIVDLISSAATPPAGWPAAQRFQSLALGKSQTFRFTIPNKAAVSQVRVRCGDRNIQEVRVPYTGR